MSFEPSSHRSFRKPLICNNCMRFGHFVAKLKFQVDETENFLKKIIVLWINMFLVFVLCITPCTVFGMITSVNCLYPYRFSYFTRSPFSFLNVVHCILESF